MQHERIYIGIRRQDGWSVSPVENVTDAELEGIDVQRDLRATLVIGGLPPSEVATLLDHQDARGIDPFVALYVDGHDCRGLELLRARVRAVQTDVRSERVRVEMEIPELWALELSPAVRSFLHELQHARADGSVGLGRAGATLREALLRGLNELAREASLPGIDVPTEREVEGTHVSPVTPRRISDPPLR